MDQYPPPPYRPALGLLTTISDLPPNFKIKYLKIKTESPLDLTNKAADLTPPITPPSCSPLKKRYRDVEDEEWSINPSPSKTILSPLKKRFRLEENQENSKDIPIKVEVTPKKNIKTASTNQKSHKAAQASTSVPKERKSKAIKKLKFDEDESSPVSGTIIRRLEDIDENDVQESGDIPDEYNIVEVTDEAKAELALIPNVIGNYSCKLCRNEFEDAFCLARHRCTCIVLLEYKCPECGKKFNCPANLASHRRWHKPRDQIVKKSDTTEADQAFTCGECGKGFKRQAYLKKHQATHRNGNVKKTNKKPVNHSPILSSSSSNQSSSQSREIIPQTVFTFNDHYSQSSQHSSSSSEHELVINENSNSSSGDYSMTNNRFTEDENIAISALANLRSGSGVIMHTMMAV